MGVDPSLERDKLKLEQEKLDFEIRKFEADEAKRSAEVAKLQAEREKAVLEAGELRVPPKKRPAYTIQKWQMIVACIAIASFIISVGTIKPTLDAYFAVQDKKVADKERDEANKAKELSEKQAEQAKRDTQQAGEKLNDLRLQIGPLEERAEAATKERRKAEVERSAAEQKTEAANREVVLAPVKELIATLDVHLSKPAPFYPEPDLRNDEIYLRSIQEIPKLLGDPNTAGIRRPVLAMAAEDSRENVAFRFTLLRGLYDAPESPEVQVDLKHQMLNLLGHADPKLPRLISPLRQLFGDYVHYYACSTYDGLSLDTQTRAYLSRALFDFKAFPECFTAVMDSFDPAFDGVSLLWQIRMLGALRYTTRLSPMNTPIALDIINIPEDIRQELLRFQRLSGPVFDPRDLVTLKAWAHNNEYLANVLTEPGMTRLKTCSPRLLSVIGPLKWIGYRELIDQCRADRWDPPLIDPATIRK